VVLISENILTAQITSFYSCGNSTSGVIGIQGTVLHGIVSNNLIVSPTFRGISVQGGTIIGNRIISCPDQAIRFSDSAVVTGNYVNGALNGIVLVSTANNSIIKNNILLGVTSTVISFTNNTSFQTVLIGENVGTSIPDIQYTLASDSFVLSQTTKTARVGTEGAAATDNLATITGGYVGQNIFLRAVSTSQVVTVQDKVGNIDLAGSSFILNSADDILQLVWNGTFWCEVSRSDNG
jgi:parallel beta-helix repeat protein